jgi:hypothetical protein
MDPPKAEPSKVEPSKADGGSDGSSPPLSPDPGAPPISNPPVDYCALMPSGVISFCGTTASGTPSQRGYLTIKRPDGVTVHHVCATQWSQATGYTLVRPANVWVSDPSACCEGGGAGGLAFPPAALTSVGYLGKPHASQWVKPQEYGNSSGGIIIGNPFSMTIMTPADGKAFLDALPMWRSYAGSGQARPAPDGTGAYYFPAVLDINFVISQDANDNIILTAGPEVFLDAGMSRPLGHPTLGACRAGGGVPLALMAGSINGSSINNSSGRFGKDPSVTYEALKNAAKLFNERGIPIQRVSYTPP